MTRLLATLALAALCAIPARADSLACDRAALARAEAGSWVRWEQIKTTRWPRRYDGKMAIFVRENSTLDEFNEQLIKVGLKKPATEVVKQ